MIIDFARARKIPIDDNGQFARITNSRPIMDLFVRLKEGYAPPETIDYTGQQMYSTCALDIFRFEIYCLGIVWLIMTTRSKSWYKRRSFYGKYTYSYM